MWIGLFSDSHANREALEVTLSHARGRGIGLQLGFIREVCSYCLISAVTSFLILLAALWHFQVTRTGH
jgi:hypothetical protein